MIEFDCPHCGNHLSHQDAFAGRDGWCRICKGIISIPQPGQPAPVVNVSPEQRYVRLERLFKHAVSIVDEYRQLQARLQNGGDGLAQEIRLRAEAERESKSLNDRVTELTTQYQSAQEQNQALTTQLSALESDRIPELEEALSESQRETDRRQTENDDLLERVLDLEQKLETGDALATKVKADRTTECDTFEQQLDALRNELCAAEEDAASWKERLEAVTDIEATLTAKLDDANATTVVEQERLSSAIDDLTSQLETEIAAYTEAMARLDEALPLVERLPGLEKDLETKRVELQASDERFELLQRQAADADRAMELSATRTNEARTAWETQRQQLLDEIESFRAGQRAAEEESASVRSKGREALADLQAQLDKLQADLANETRLRIASEESEQRLQRRNLELTGARDEALARRDQVSRQLETALERVETAQRDVTQLRATIAESESTEASLQLRLTEARTERDSAVEIRQQLTEKLDDATNTLESAQRVNAQLRARIVDLENEVSAAREDNASAEEQHTELTALNDEVGRLTVKTADLEDALGAANREKTRLEQRLVGAENRVAYSELEGIGSRSNFSSMAKQFFEQEVARQTDAQDDRQNAIDGLHPSDSARAALLDAVTELRR